MTDIIMPEEYAELNADEMDLDGGTSTEEILGYVALGLSVVATGVQIGGMVYAARAQPAAPSMNEIRAAGGFPERDTLNYAPMQRGGSLRPNAPRLSRLDVDEHNITIVDNDFDKWSIHSA